jgi:hypothetical protein
MAKNPFQGDDVDPFSAVRDEETGETAYKGPSEDEIERLEKRASKSEDTKPKNFRQAFAAARRAGDKTFMFGGKKFTTELAKPAARKDPDADKGPSKETIERLERKAAAPKVSQARGSMKEKMRSMGVTRYKSGGSVKSSASKRADGCAVRGKTRGKMV